MISEEPIIKLVASQWEKAFAAARKIDSLSARQPQPVWGIGEAQGELWGAVAALVANWGGDGTFDPARDAKRYQKILNLVTTTCEMLPAMPSYLGQLEAQTWQTFFQLVEAGRAGRTTYANQLSKTLGVLYPSNSPEWWKQRAETYAALGFIAEPTRI